MAHCHMKAYCQTINTWGQFQKGLSLDLKSLLRLLSKTDAKFVILDLEGFTKWLRLGFG